MTYKCYSARIIEQIINFKSSCRISGVVCRIAPENVIDQHRFLIPLVADSTAVTAVVTAAFRFIIHKGIIDENGLIGIGIATRVTVIIQI